MSRRTRDDPAAERTKRVAVQDSPYKGGLTTHRSTGNNFLSPEVPYTNTNLDRAHSLNRLHAQSSTETSGLGETITSGFSSQESVHSYGLDDKEKGGSVGSSWDRNRRSRGSGGVGAEEGDRPDTKSYSGGRSYNPHYSRPDQPKQQQPQQPQKQQQQQPPQQQQQQQQQQQKPSNQTKHPKSNGGSQSREPSQTNRRNSGSRSDNPLPSQPGEDRHSQSSTQRPDNNKPSSRNKNNVKGQSGRAPGLQEGRSESTERSKRHDKYQREGDHHRSDQYDPQQQQQRKSQPQIDPPPQYQRRRNSQPRPRRDSEEGDRRDADPGQQDNKTASDRRGRLKSTGSSGNNSRDHGYPDTSVDRDSTQRQSSVGKKVPTEKPSRKSRSLGKDNSSETPTVRSGSKDSVFRPDHSRSSSQDTGRSSLDGSSRDKDRKPSASREPKKSSSSNSRTNSDELQESGSSKKSFETVRLRSRSLESVLNSGDEGSAPYYEGDTVRRPELDKQKSSESAKRRANVPGRRIPSEPPQNEFLRSVNGNNSNRASGSSQDQTDSLPSTDDRRRLIARDEERKNSSKDRRDSSGSKGDATSDSTCRRSRSSTGTQGTDSGRGRRKVEGDNSRDHVDNDYDDRNREHVRDSRRPRDELSRVSRPSENADRVKPTRASRDPAIGANSAVGSHPSHDKAHYSVNARRTTCRAKRPYTDFQSDENLHRPPLDQADGVGSSYETLADELIDRKTSSMDYDHLFPSPSRGVNGLGGGGGGGSRGYPAVLDGGYAVGPSRRAGGGEFGALMNSSSNDNSNSNTINNISDQPNEIKPDGLIPIINNNNNKSASYTKFQVPSTPKTQRAIPTVQLTMTGDDSALHLEHIQREWDRRGSKTSLQSRGSSQRGSGKTKFLGVSTESAWTKWSRDRRASYRRRLERLRDEEAIVLHQDINRVPTPVKKARQEGLKFVSPDLESTYLSEDDLNELRIHKQQQVKAMRVIEKTKKSKFRMKTEVKLTADQWQVLQDFWDHSLFTHARMVGLLVSVLAIIFMVVSIANPSWVSLSITATNLTAVEGLWRNCSRSIIIHDAHEECQASGGRSWQNAVIGLMVFAAAFGFLASVLSVCGVCTNPLPKKIYYFHSAGEIFFISALSTGVALLIFPVAIETDSTISNHRYGIGYGLGWAGAFFFLAAAVCMSLDDLVRESSRAKCCRWCWRSKHNDRTELRQV